MSKPKLLILHGAIGDAKQMQALEMFLKDYFELIFFNFFGHSGKAMKFENFSIDNFKIDLLQFLESEKLSELFVFGYSMGAYVALKLASENPTRFKKIVSLGTKFDWNKDSAEKEIKMLNPDKIEEKLPAFAEILNNRHAPNNWKTVLHKTAEMMLEEGENPSLTEKDFAKISIPVKLMVGSLDTVAGTEATIQTAQKMKVAEWEIIENWPHPFEKIDLSFLAKKISEGFLG